MRLTAKATIKHGPAGEIAQPGDSFEMDEKKYPESVAQLLESGDAVKAGSSAASSTSSSSKKTGPLPEDFPGRTALEEAGIDTYAKVRAAGDLTKIPGIGEATADKIAEAVKD